jgi:hypothetical protein
VAATAGPELAPVQVRDDVPRDAERAALVVRQVIGESGHGRMHVRAAELLVRGFLASGHLHERRAGEERLRAPRGDRVVGLPGTYATPVVALPNTIESVGSVRR